MVKVIRLRLKLSASAHKSSTAFGIWNEHFEDYVTGRTSVAVTSIVLFNIRRY